MKRIAYGAVVAALGAYTADSQEIMAIPMGEMMEGMPPHHSGGFENPLAQLFGGGEEEMAPHMIPMELPELAGVESPADALMHSPLHVETTPTAVEVSINLPHGADSEKVSIEEGPGGMMSITLDERDENGMEKEKIRESFSLPPDANVAAMRKEMRNGKVVLHIPRSGHHEEQHAAFPFLGGLGRHPHPHMGMGPLASLFRGFRPMHGGMHGGRFHEDHPESPFRHMLEEQLKEHMAQEKALEHAGMGMNNILKDIIGQGGKVNVTTADGQIRVKFSLPHNVNKEDVHLKDDGKLLTVTCNHPPKNGEIGEKFIETFEMPYAPEAGDIKAEFEEHALVVSFPSKGHEIHIVDGHHIDPKTGERTGQSIHMPHKDYNNGEQHAPSHPMPPTPVVLTTKAAPTPSPSPFPSPAPSSNIPVDSHVVESHRPGDAMPTPAPHVAPTPTPTPAPSSSDDDSDEWFTSSSNGEKKDAAEEALDG